MNRLGWSVLLFFVLVGVGFLLIVRPGGSGPEPVSPAPTPATPARGGLLIPVEGVTAAELADSWSDVRGGGARAHHAIDIMAARGTPVVAAAPGRIEKLFESRDGGHTVYQRSPDGRAVYYYAHLDAYAAGLRAGLSVLAGQRIGTVGSTGDASPEAPHLHFEVHDMAPGEPWWQGREVNPYPMLTAKVAG